jgi:hypothetical protein
MSRLNKDQIEQIRKDLEDQQESRSFLFNEWVDHVCCDVESLMNKGLSFEESLHRVSGKPGETGISSAHREVQQFMNHMYVGIKKLLLLAFLVFSVGWVVNLQGAGDWIGLASFIILGIVYLRIAVDFLRKRFTRRINVLLSVFSFLSFAGTTVGILLIFLNRNYGVSTKGHGVDLTIFSWFFFSLTCLVYYLREYRSSMEKTELRKNRSFIILTLINLFLASLSVASFPLYRQVQSYLFFLILFILGFNVLALVYLLLTRSMKNTLVLSLIIGCLMTVFIQSHFRSKLPGGKPRLYEITLQLSPAAEQAVENLYLTMYYDRFPDKPFTLPLQETGENLFEITLPSYAYRGYLYYSVETDSSDALQYFSRDRQLDSLMLRVPNKKVYRLHYHSDN